MRLISLFAAIAIAVALALWVLQAIDLTALSYWAAQQQRALQNAMAGDLRAISSGDIAALFALCGLTFAYGFVHAVGPGHGKMVLGAAAISSRATLRRMVVLTIASSLAQSLTAILLVVGGVLLINLSSGAAIDLTERYLAPLSFAAIGAIGILLAHRGARAAWIRSGQRTATDPATHDPHDHHHHDHDDGACGCGHQHGPSVEDVSDLSSWKEALALIASIAIRPCTGALFLLVISWRLQILPAGVLATFAMGLGTASFNLMVAGTGVGSRFAATALVGNGNRFALVSPIVQMTAGLLLIIVSTAMLRPYL